MSYHTNVDFQKELKLCPFCGSNKARRNDLYNWKAVCLDCGAESPYEQWNNRPIEKALQVEIDRLRGVIQDIEKAAWFKTADRPNHYMFISGMEAVFEIVTEVAKQALKEANHE